MRGTRPAQPALRSTGTSPGDCHKGIEIPSAGRSEGPERESPATRLAIERNYEPRSPCLRPQGMVGTPRCLAGANRRKTMRKIVSAALAATLALAIVVTLAIVSLRSDARTRPYAPASVDTLELM